MKFENKPNSVQIELTHGCNRQCSYCGTMGFKREFKYIEESTLQKICDLIKNSEYNPRIILGGAGEPTMHPDLINRLKLIRENLPDKQIQLINNGFWIKKYGYEFVKEILKYVNDVAIDDYDSDISKESLQKYISEFENENKCKVDFVTLQNGVSFYAEKNPNKRRVMIVPAIDETQDLKSRKFSNHCGAGMPQSNKYNDKICTMIFRDMIIRFDGNVPICCDDFRGEYLVCNVLSESYNKLEDVWNHRRLDSARKVLKYKHRKFIHPCDVCTASNIREGFLPEVSEPTEEDLRIVSQKNPPLYEIVKRKWEIVPNLNQPLF